MSSITLPDGTVIDSGSSVPTGTSTGLPKGYTPPVDYPPVGEPPQTPQAQQGMTYIGSPRNASPYNIELEAWAPERDPASVATLQSQLVQAGLVSSADVRIGLWDQTMADAYKNALTLANTYGATVQDTLSSLIANAKLGRANSGIPKAPFPITNPATISAEVNTVNGANTAQQMLGHNLSAADTADFTKYYQGQETAARKQYMAADMSGPGNFYTQAPSLSASAQEYIKSKHLNDAVAYGTAQRALQFFSMLHGAGGTSANLG